MDAQPSAIGPWPENIAGENSDFSEVPRGDVNGIIISAKIMNWIILIKIGNSSKLSECVDWFGVSKCRR